MTTTLKTELGLAFVGILLFCSCASKGIRVQQEAPPEKVPAWVELGPNHQVYARTLSQETVCPEIELDSVKQAMTLRVASSSAFPLSVCEMEIPQQTQMAKIRDIPLSLPKLNPKRIVVLGDTGCRVKINSKSNRVQDCNDPNAWPLSKITTQVSQWNPDLVIHVGDYLYRESPCPNGNTGCAGSPSGDTWKTWDADFFSPTSSLLTSAPWIFVRGNHELCERAGEGWFRFLDPRPYLPQCKDFTDPYSIQVGKLKMFVLDSANAEDDHLKSDHVQKYVSQLKEINKQALQDKTAWILTHRPFWAAAGNWDTSSKSHPSLTLNQTLQEATQGHLSSSLKLILSGHIHLFEALTFSDSGPSQLVLGNSGTELAETPQNLNSIQIGKRKVKQGIAIHDFGYLTLEQQESGRWQATAYNATGSVLQICTIDGSQLACH